VTAETAEHDRRGALEAVERLLSRGGDADDVLRAVVAVLHERLGRFCRLSFVEGEDLVAGPAAGEATVTTGFPIRWEGRQVAELEVGGELEDADRALFDRVALLVSPYALVGWDTGGESWSP
jgi:hypothetical protein